MKSIGTEKDLFLGKDIVIDDNIKIRIPKIGEIIKFGEDGYIELLNSLIGTPEDNKVELANARIDYSQLNAYDLFLLRYTINALYNTEFILNVDFANFEAIQYPLLKKVVLYDSVKGIAISEFTHMLISDHLKRIHGIQENESIEQVKHIFLGKVVSEFPNYAALPISTFVVMLKNGLFNLRDQKYN